MIDRDELSAWLRLLLTHQVGPQSVRRLLAALGSPQAVFTTPRVALRGLISEREIANLADEPDDLPSQLDRAWRWLRDDEAQEARHVLTLADPRYPAALLEAPDPPPLLFAQGRLDLLARPAVAVVGSRSPTEQGRDNAHEFARAFSAAGITVVSGLALGIDGAAHEGALAALDRAPGTLLEAAGSTIAVIGTGADRVYPSRHRALAHRIAADGLILTEFPFGTPPLAGNFPKRNRLIAALSRGVLVVEAAVQSGSLHTARLALEMSREVMAIPGSIHSPQARGCHLLIKQGAKLVETAQDVIEELRLGAPVRVVPDASTSSALRESASGHPLLDAMGFDPVSLDALAARTGWSPAQLSSGLLELELEGEVARLPGQLFQRRRAA